MLREPDPITGNLQCTGFDQYTTMVVLVMVISNMPCRFDS